MSRSYQCDQIICSIYGHVQQRKFAQELETFAQVGSSFSQILNNPLKWPKNLPNLVTLVPSYVFSNDLNIEKISALGFKLRYLGSLVT